jgi:hypothetical protein
MDDEKIYAKMLLRNLRQQQRNARLSAEPFTARGSQVDYD